MEKDIVNKPVFTNVVKNLLSKNFQFKNLVSSYSHGNTLNLGTKVNSKV